MPDVIIITSNKPILAMLRYLSDTDIITRLAAKIIEPKNAHYTEDPIHKALAMQPQYSHVDSVVFNKYEQRLKVSLFYDKRVKEPTFCVVFMHGYGSNRIEGVSILPHLPNQYSLCCFDFSAEGKSEGEFVTYGQKEKDDIRAVLNYLRSCGYKKFALWGRSMGATCTLLYTQKQKPKDVFIQVIDSPFSSFQQAAFQLTRKRTKVPEMIIRLALDAVKENLRKKQFNFNPFQVNLNQQISSNIPTLFVFSEDDDVVNPENSHRIIRNFQGHYQKVIIHEHHNSIRYPKTIGLIAQMIKNYSHPKQPRPSRMANFKERASLEIVSTSLRDSVKFRTSNTDITLTTESHLSRNSTQKLPSKATHNFDYGFEFNPNLGNQRRQLLNSHKLRASPHKQTLNTSIGTDTQPYIKKRPNSSIKVFSAMPSLPLSPTFSKKAEPINLRGSHASRSSSSNKFHKQASLSNDIYI